MELKGQLHNFCASIVLLFLSLYTVESFTFTKTDSSYVEFFPDWLPTSKQGVAFRFKTLEANALLYLHHFANKTDDEPSYLFWFELRHGQLLASHLLDSHMETFSLNTKLNDDQWHTVNYTKNLMEGDLSISVDATTVGLSLYQTDVISAWLQNLESMSAVSFGGLSSSSSAMVSKDLKHLAGCVEDIYFLTGDMETWKEIDYSMQEGTVPGCVDRCASEMPCVNGRCVNSYASTYCDCIGSGYHGIKCEIQGNAVVTFQGFNFLQVTMFPSDNKMPMDDNHINLSFKVGKEQLVGMLLYAAGALPVQTYLAIFIKKGRLVVDVKLGTSSNTFYFEDQPNVNDDRWHYVTFIHNGKTIEVQLNGESYRQEVMDGEGLFHFDGQILIGGGQNLNGFPGLDGPANLVGCLREIYIDRFNVMEALAVNASGLTFFGGHPIFQCRPVGYPPITFPSDESTLILDGWKNGSMDLMFDVKTEQSNGLIMLVLLDVDKKMEGRLRMELVDTYLLVHMDVGTAPGQRLSRNTLRSSPVINDTRWHSVALHLRDGVCTFVVDGVGSTLTYPYDLSASSSLYLGGGWRGQGTGFKGCVRHIVFQKKEVIATQVIDTAAANGVLLNNCPVSNPCAAGDFVCQHGGTCSHITGGARCNCEGTGYVGAMCSYSTYKQSCAQNYHSGDRVSGVKMLDLDGQGPLDATYVNCSYSAGSVETTVEHNFAARTLVRDVHLPSLDFNVTYRNMINKQLEQLVLNSQRCTQYFSFWCFEAPLFISKGWTVLHNAAGRRLRHYNLPFATHCNLNAKEWNVDHGFITNMESLPVVSMQFYKLPSVPSNDETTKGTLSLGPLHCSTNLKENRGRTVTITRSQDYITLDTWRSHSLYLKFRTSVENIVLFHQMSGGSNTYTLTAIVRDAFNLRVTLEMNGEFYDGLVQSSQPMTDGQWHTMTVERSLIDIRITVDFSEGFLNLPKGVILKPFTGPFLLAGMKKLPKGTQGMTGCMTDFTFNGGIVFLYDYYEHEETLQIEAGCVTACDSNPCKNGGSCIDRWNTFACNCIHPAHTGHDCGLDNTQDVVSFTREGLFLEYEPNNTDILTSDLQLGFRTIQPQALIMYARDNWNNFIQMELVDGTAFVLTFNSGRDIHKVVINSSESTCPALMKDRPVMCTDLCQDDSECSLGMKCCSTGCGTKCVVPDAGYPLNDGQWVEVAIQRQDDKTVVNINQRKAEIPIPVNLLADVYIQPFNDQETVLPNRDAVSTTTAVMMQVFIGGAPDSMTTLPGLMGCVRGLLINAQPWRLQDLVRIMQRLFTSKAPSLQCENHCSMDPCKNGGICTEFWTGFKCNCSGTTYTGKTCEEEYGAQFKDESMLSIPLTLKMDPSLADLEQDNLEFGFSTDQPSGVLFYVRNGESSDVEERLMIILNQGDLEAHIDLGAGETVLRVLGPFNDTFRHAVVFRRFGSRILFDVDNIGFDYETLEPSDETEFNDRELMLIGGVEMNMTEYGLQGLQGYQGCLTGLNYNGKHPLVTLFTSNPARDASSSVRRQQCPMFQLKEENTTVITTATPKGPSVVLTMAPWDSLPAQGVKVDLPSDLVASSEVNWVLIAAVSGAGVAVLLFFLCCCCILKANKKKDKEVFEEKQHLVKPQDEVHIVHPVREVAVEAKCLDAPPDEPSDSPRPSQSPIQEHASWGGLMVPAAGDKMSCADSLSDDAAFLQLEVEAGVPDHKGNEPSIVGTSSEENQDLNLILQRNTDTVWEAELPGEPQQGVNAIPVMTEDEENLLQFPQPALKDEQEVTVPVEKNPPHSESEETSV